MKLVIACAEGEAAYDELLGSIADLEIVRVESTADAITEIGDADVDYGRPSDELVVAGANLKLIQAQIVPGSISSTRCRYWPSSVPLANTRGAHAPSIAEHTFGLLLSLTRAIPISIGWQKASEWHQMEGYRLPREIMGSTMGIIGMA